MCALRPRTKFRGWVSRIRTVFALSFVSCINYWTSFAIGTTVAAAVLPAGCIHQVDSHIQAPHRCQCKLLTVPSMYNFIDGLLESVCSANTTGSQRLWQADKAAAITQSTTAAVVRGSCKMRNANKDRKRNLSRIKCENYRYPSTLQKMHENIEINNRLANGDVTVLVAINAYCTFYF